MTERRGKPELLAPAKDLEVLRTAVLYGADAVYIGGEAFSLRAGARNFTDEEMAEGIRFAHAHGAKVYVTANIYAHNRDLDGAAAYFARLKEIGPDALLIADPGMFQLAQEICPEIPVHISTQANSTNYRTFRFWYALGVRRLVCARELSLQEIREIREKVPADCEIEAFVHGAMCISYSGRCLLSAYFTGRDANHGACTHPCRWKYAVAEEKRPGVWLPIEENERGTYVFNGGDICMIGHIPEMIAAGIGSFKIEGRMKNALYTATVTRAYRRAIDLLFEEGEEAYRAQVPALEAEIRRCTYRKFTTGFYFGRPAEEAMVYDSNTYTEGAVWLGIAEEVRKEEGAVPCRLHQRNKFVTGETVTMLGQDGRDRQMLVAGISDTEGTEMDSAPHPQQELWIRLLPAERTSPEDACEVRCGDVLRIIRD